MTDTAAGLLARWILDGLLHPTTPEELAAVGRLRLDMALRLPADERTELLRLLDSDVTPTDVAPTTIGKEGINRWHD